MENISKTPASMRLSIIRNKNRPTINDYIPRIFKSFTKLSGDRLYGDDKAIMGGIALLSDIPVTVIGQVKGRNLAENKETNFSMPHPEGYRKALRLAHSAEKFKRPVICLIDTPGAFCGIEAEKRGQGEAIARCLYEFSILKTPVIGVILGEGGSGGALALGVCDELSMLRNALYSVISPKGFSSILWKDGSREMQAADVLKITSEDMLNFGVVDKIIEETPDSPLESTGGKSGAHEYVEFVSGEIQCFLKEAVERLLKIPIDVLLEKRYQRYRKFTN